MNEDSITLYIQETFPDARVVHASKENGAPEASWGDTFFFYNSPGEEADEQKFPFATIVTRDYPDFDFASNLNRPGVFRLNIGISRETYRFLFDTDTHD